MATKKQRRRRAKDRRHDYEYVWVDEEGEEVEVDEPEPNGARPSRRKDAPARSRGRTVQPPSWKRVAKRGLIFAPLMYITVLLLSPDEFTTAQKVQQTLFLLLIFLPFSYVMDSVTYRIWRKRNEKSQG
jgi:hypothetical protein